MHDGATQYFNWAIAGYGDVVSRRILPAIKAEAKAKITSIYGRTQDKVDAIAARFNAQLATTNIDEAIYGADALYVATPVSGHLTAAIAALSKGCPVLIEKPLCTGIGDIQTFLELAENTKTPVGIAYYRRHYPWVRWLNQKISTTDFGAFKSAQINFSCPFDPAPNHPMAWRLNRNISGGGVLADAGSHRLDLLCYWFGMPETVKATFSNFSKLGAESRASLKLKWREGGTANICTEWNNRSIDQLLVTFDKAEVSINGLDSGQISIEQNGERNTHDFAMEENPHAAAIRDFQASVEHDTLPACTIHQALMVDAILAAAHASSKLSTNVALPQASCNSTEIARFVTSYSDKW